MAKRIYSQFENDKVVAITVNMSNDHLAVYSKKFDVDLDVLIEMRDVKKAKVVYINLDSEYLIAYKDKDGDFRTFPTYVQFIEQNHKKLFLYSLKPLGTPKLPKVRKPQVDSVAETVTKNKVVDLPVVLELDPILDKIGKYGINSITKEEKDFLDNLN
jgi:hypothetical protein